MKFTRIILNILLFAVAAAVMPSCSDDDNTSQQQVEVDQTVVMFFPWSTNLTKYFRQNVRDFSKAIAQRGLHNERVMVFMATSQQSAVLFELKAADGKCVSDTLRRYSNRQFHTRAQMTRLFSELKRLAPAHRYGMVVGSHGLAWLPVDRQQKMPHILKHYEAGSTTRTRYMGGLTADCQISTTDFAGALADSKLSLEYVLFDNCYMSSVEVAYEMKGVADYIVASPTEVMMYGFPYYRGGQYLLGTADYRQLAESFMSYYRLSSSPYATVAVIDCKELDALAACVRLVNQNSPNETDASKLQAMDGYTPTLFVDLGSYITAKCSDAELLRKFNEQLQRTVIYKDHTPQYFSDINGTNPISEYSGLTTSEPSQNPLATEYDNTLWYKATH